MKKSLFVLGLMSLCFVAKAQEEKFIVIDKGVGRIAREKKTRPLVDNSTVMKFSPLQMLVGEINFGLEKKIDEMSSIEFEVGPTLSNIDVSVSGNHYFNPNGFGYSQETSKVGFFASTGYRFYPMDNGKVLNSFYVSPVFKYRLMNFGVHDYSGILKDTKGSENDFNFSFNFGFQKWLSESFSLDFFGGIGLAYESHIHYNAISAYNGNTGMYDYYWDRNAYSGVRFLVTGGVKVGIGK